jgi:hypothetical protein
LTALRQTWTPMTALPFWAPLALLGFAPWMILLQLSISLIYQFWMSQTYTWPQTRMAGSAEGQVRACRLSRWVPPLATLKSVSK